jgi:spore germination protein KC
MKMKKKFNMFLMLYIIFNFLTGCWSRTELNELGIVAALGIDKTEEGYLVTAQLINPSEIAGQARSGRTEVVSFKKSGETIYEAVRRLSTDSPRRIYVAHLREVVFGEELAKEGIGKALDVLSRQHEMRSDFFITIAKGSTAYDTLNIQTALEKLPATKINNALKNSERSWAPTKTVTLDELISSIVSRGKEPVLPGIYIYGDPEAGSDIVNANNVSPEAGIRIDSLGVFKKDKLLGWLSEEESKGFNYITDNVKSTAVTFQCEGGNITIDTVRSKTNVKGKVEKGVPKININIRSEGTIGEVGCKIDVSKQENIEKLEEKYKKNIKDKIEFAIKKVQEEYKSDIFGFGEVIHREDPEAWKYLKPNWDEEIANLEVTVNVEANIRRLGTISESFQKEIEE